MSPPTKDYYYSPQSGSDQKFNNHSGKSKSRHVKEWRQVGSQQRIIDSAFNTVSGTETLCCNDRLNSKLRYVNSKSQRTPFVSPGPADVNPNPSAKPRLRFVKKWRQVSSQQGSTFNNIHPGFNPFHSYSNADVKPVKLENVGFVFSTSRDDTHKVEPTQSTGKSCFGSCNSKKNPHEMKFCETVGNADDLKVKLHDLSDPNFSFGKAESSQNVGTISDDNMGFQSGSNYKKSTPGLKFDKKQKKKQGQKSVVVDNMCWVKRDINSQIGSHDNIGFVLRTSQNDSSLNSNVERENFINYFRKCASNDTGKKKAGFDAELKANNNCSMPNLNSEEKECSKEKINVCSESDFQRVNTPGNNVLRKNENFVNFDGNAKIETTNLGFDEKDDHTFGGKSDVFKLSDDIMKNLNINTPTNVSNVGEANFFNANYCPGMNKKLNFKAKSRTFKDRRQKKERGNDRKFTLGKNNKGRDSIRAESCSPDCSPMDFSPYQETSTVNNNNNGIFLSTMESVSINSSEKGTEPNQESLTHEKQCPGSGDSSNTQGEVKDCGEQFFNASGSRNIANKSFSFSASCPAPHCESTAKHQFRNKNRSKGVGDTKKTDSNVGDHFPSTFSSTTVGKKGKISSEERNKIKSEKARSTCEKWRLRGNEAYENGAFSKAEDCYTHGINSVPCGETLESCLELLVLCYNYRATTRMSLLKIREALLDCKMAIALDQSFLNAQIRAANCHLVLGEVNEALQYYSTCANSGNGFCLDRRIIIEAFEGIQKAKKVDEYTKQSVELLQKKTSTAVASALGLITEALSISTYSEILLEMNAQALCMSQKYEDVIHLSKKTNYFAEKNFASLNPWRICLMSKSYFCMGKIETALNLLEKQDQDGTNKDTKLEPLTKLAMTIRQLLRNKNAGNEAYQAGKYTEAVDYYTAALAINVESRPFAAICLCNRAAAYQALGQFIDAISDCSLAAAFDEGYQKAISRRVTLHETIRDFEHAAIDLKRLISILENQSPCGTSNSNAKEIKQAKSRLSVIEEEAKKGTPKDLYLIMGLKGSDDTQSEIIKKAYKKAALRHHPDKAGQFLSRSCDGGVQLWKDKVLTEVQKDADRLFKMISEAYSVLSDPSKRSEYDCDESLRTACSERSGFRHSQEDEKSTNTPRMYKTYGTSYSRW